MKFRHEYKHPINHSDVCQLRLRLGNLFDHDEHSTADGTYVIKSLYFDNYMDKALREKQDGINRREKFRIRYYNDDTSFIRLEKKTKVNGLCNKQSAPLTKEEVQKIISGDISFLLNGESDLKKELYAKMYYQLLRPKCIVKYVRESFVYDPGHVRITIDSEISGSSNVTEFLNPELSFTRLYPYSILEVKWDEFLPKIAMDAVQMKNRSTTAFSKYAAVRY